MTKDEPPPIELSTFWPYQVVVLADQISRRTASIAKARAELNLSQWRVLAAIAEKSGRSAAQVTALTPMDKTIVSRAVNSLIDQGYVRRKIDALDKRKSQLHATAKGARVYVKIAQDLRTIMIEEFSAPIPPAQFSDILKAYSAQMPRLPLA